jgi:hypothetical protein
MYCAGSQPASSKTRFSNKPVLVSSILDKVGNRAICHDEKS